MKFNNLDSLNNLFYNDSYYRKVHLQKAKSLYENVTNELGLAPASILALGRSWLSEYLIEENYNVSYPRDIQVGAKFDLVIALDEVLTRDSDEVSQKNHITTIASMISSNGVMLASLRDFKNTSCHKRALGDACFHNLDKSEIVTVEINKLNNKDKQNWSQYLHVTVDDKEFSCIDAGPRRTIYFKQLAKYCADAGVEQFGILKNVYWKGHLRRTPEHVAYARAKQ